MLALPTELQRLGKLCIEIKNTITVTCSSPQILLVHTYSCILIGWLNSLDQSQPISRPDFRVALAYSNHLGKGLDQVVKPGPNFVML